VKQEVIARHHVPSHPGVLKKGKYEWNILYFRDILLVNNSNNRGQNVSRKTCIS